MIQNNSNLDGSNVKNEYAITTLRFLQSTEVVEAERVSENHILALVTGVHMILFSSINRNHALDSDFI